MSHGHPAPGSPLPQQLGFSSSNSGKAGAGRGHVEPQGTWPEPCGTDPGTALPPSPARRAPAHAASGAQAAALVIKEPLLRSVIQPQGGFMQNDTQYK